MLRKRGRQFLINMNGLTSLQIIFIVTASVFVVAILLFFLLFFRYKHVTKQNFRNFYYKKVYKIAFAEDYYLINNFLFRLDEEHMANIDHILFGNKYIYLIVDYFFEGDLTGEERNNSFIYFNKFGKKFYTPNVLDISENILNRISLLTGIEKSLLIGITLINDRCRIGVESHRKSVYMIQRKRIKKLIKAIESRNVGNINEEQLHDAVLAINKLNRRNRS